VKIPKVTRGDVRQAALIGQIIAEAALAETAVTCVVDDDDCCGHMLEEHCVAEALEAPKMVSNAIAMRRRDRAKDIAEAKTASEKQRLGRLYAWVDSVGGHVAVLGVAELHAAALLRDGVLPPDWDVVSDHVVAHPSARRSVPTKAGCE